MTSSAAADLKPEGWIAGGKECERCPFTKTCGIERRAVPRASDASVDPQFIAEMRELAIACKAHQSNADDANGKARETQREIRERLRAKGLRKIAGEDFGITWSPVKGRPGIDVDALSAAAAAAGVDVSQFKTEGDPSDRLTVLIRAVTSRAA